MIFANPYAIHAKAGNHNKKTWIPPFTLRKGVSYGTEPGITPKDDF
jgi:hypothetical protein